MEPIYSRTVPPCNYIRSSDFSLQDLSIFVDSMETIERIKNIRKEQRRMKKINIKSVAEVHPIPKDIQVEENSEEEPSKASSSPKQQQKRIKLNHQSVDTDLIQAASSSSGDENYFSRTSESSEDSNDMDIDGIQTLPPDSGTESENMIYKQRPRTFAMTNPKYRATRARIIGLVLKREYANGGNKEDTLEQQERRERLLEGLILKKKKNINIINQLKSESVRVSTKDSAARKPLPQCKTKTKASAEMKFIDKALRYLTL